MKTITHKMMNDVLELFTKYGKIHTAEPGQEIRKKGSYYDSVCLLTDGAVIVSFDNNGSLAREIHMTGYSAIGEMSFLSGRPAIADVVVSAPSKYIEITDQTFQQLEKQEPVKAALLLRYLATTMEHRQNYNAALNLQPDFTSGGEEIEIIRCRTREQKQEAYRLRYDIYCEELGYKPPAADHSRHILSDSLDHKAHVLIAKKYGNTIGTIRANSLIHGNLGVFESLYNMGNYPDQPNAKAIVTKFMVRPTERNGIVAMKLIAELARIGRDDNVSRLFIDCVRGLLHYYQALGFRQCGEPFIHPDTGQAIPLTLDFDIYGSRLAKIDQRNNQALSYLRSRWFKISNRLQ